MRTLWTEAMIRQSFHLDRFDWKITVFYAVHGYYPDVILDELRRIGIRGKKFAKAEENLTSGEINSGLTYVNNGEAVGVIGIASSAAQYMDSIVHEVMHLAKFIGKAEGLDPYGEEVCYMGGEIARKMWPKSKLLTSECGCYTKRIGKVL